MSDLHFLSVTGNAAEAVDPRFLKEGLLEARRKSWEILKSIQGLLEEGMTEDQARRLCLDVFRGAGVKKHWHKPYVRFASGTLLTFNDPIQPDYQLKPGDPVYIDLGPVWSYAAKLGEAELEYEGDVGDSFVFSGTHPEAERCAAMARQLFGEASANWRTHKWTGAEIYDFLRDRATEEGYVFVEVVQGHRLSDFPHHKYSKERFARTQFQASELLWVLEVQLKHPTLGFGAFYEDILGVPKSRS